MPRSHSEFLSAEPLDALRCPLIRQSKAVCSRAQSYVSKLHSGFLQRLDVIVRVRHWHDFVGDRVYHKGRRRWGGDGLVIAETLEQFRLGGWPEEIVAAALVRVGAAHVDDGIDDDLQVGARGDAIHT